MRGRLSKSKRVTAAPPHHSYDPKKERMRNECGRRGSAEERTKSKRGRDMLFYNMLCRAASAVIVQRQAQPAKQITMFIDCNCTWKMEGKTNKMQWLILRIPTWRPGLSALEKNNYSQYYRMSTYRLPALEDCLYTVQMLRYNRH
jgi:hypothetical protein